MIVGEQEDVEAGVLFVDFNRPTVCFAAGVSFVNWIQRRIHKAESFLVGIGLVNVTSTVSIQTALVGHQQCNVSPQVACKKHAALVGSLLLLWIWLEISQAQHESKAGIQCATMVHVHRLSIGWF